MKCGISYIFMLLLGLVAVAQDKSAYLNPGGPPFKDKVTVCVNSGKVLCAEEIGRISRLWVKSMDVGADTVMLTLKGPSIAAMGNRLKPAYRAEMKIEGEKCVYKKDEIPEFRPKTSQYMLSDSCFYLTFELSPDFQTKGEKTWISMLMVLDSLPEIGRHYPITGFELEEDNPIKEWSGGMGDVVTVQLAYMPLCSKIFANDAMTPAMKGKCMILNSTDVSDGYVEVVEFTPSLKSKPGRIKLKFQLEAEISGTNADRYSRRIKVSDGVITLNQVEATNLRPLLFEIDYGWGDSYVPDRR